MSARKYALGLLLLVLLGGTAAAESACGPPTNAEDPATPKKPKPADTTEVKMEVSDVDAGAPPVVGTTSIAPTPSDGGAATSTAIDPSEDPNIGGKQDNPAVEKAVAPTRPRLRACYKKALAAEPSLTGGSATFDATIGKDGKVTGARFVKKSGLSEDTMSCLLPIIKSMTFEGAQKSQIVTLTFGTPPASTATAADAGAAPKK